MLLGDAAPGKFADNLAAFGRVLRRAGLPVDSGRIALAQQAAMLVGIEDRDAFAAALECVLVSREQDRRVFAELFAGFFRDPVLAQKLMLDAPWYTGKRAPEPPLQRRRARQALAPATRAPAAAPPPLSERRLEVDVALEASALRSLRQADFAQLDAEEYRRLERLAGGLRATLPHTSSRRYRRAARGSRADGCRTLHAAVSTAGEVLRLEREQRVRVPVPLLVVVDVSGSMERYARMLLVYLHGALRGLRGTELFALGTGLTRLTPAFARRDADDMLEAVAAAVPDFAGGTLLGEGLQALRRLHGRRLVGGRTLVLLISDGLETGDAGLLRAELAALRRRTGSLAWLNPLLRFEGYQPLAQGAAALHAQVDAMLPVHNLASLEDLALRLPVLLRRLRRGRGPA